MTELAQLPAVQCPLHHHQVTRPQAASCCCAPKLEAQYTRKASYYWKRGVLALQARGDSSWPQIVYFVTCTECSGDTWGLGTTVTWLPFSLRDGDGARSQINNYLDIFKMGWA